MLYDRASVAAARREGGGRVMQGYSRGAAGGDMISEPDRHIDMTWGNTRMYTPPPPSNRKPTDYNSGVTDISCPLCTIGSVLFMEVFIYLLSNH